MDDLEEDFYPPRRSNVGRVFVGLVVAAAIVLMAWAAEKRYHLVEWVEATARHGGVPSQVDPRIASLAADGERALVAGELDAAQTAFDKASVLAEGDPRVTLDLARVAAARADVDWLTLRLLPPDATDAQRVAKADLGEHAAVALRAAQEAVTARPDDPLSLTTKIDALRVSGETDAARAYVVAVFARASDPETAYVLAALEMTQATPPWTSIVDRLRIASAGEWSSGRSHAALAYALARAGDASGAKVEMNKLEALARPYPCLPSLKAFLGSAASSPVVAASVVDAGAPAVADSGADAAHLARGGAGQAGQGSADESGDTTPSGGLVAANQAMAVHDFSHAEQIYQAILTSEPGDSQALSGLGDIARARGDNDGAVAAYRRAVAQNPSYLPALLGLADTQWFSGNHAAAVSGYKNIEDHFPEGTYPPYVRSRAGGQ